MISSGAEARESGRHEWACFAAQQSTEQLVKALHLSLGQEAWGHVVAKLLRELPGELEVPEDLIDRGRVLDNFYIPSRYPNSHPEGAPFEHDGILQSEEALSHARAIAEFVRTPTSRSSGAPRASTQRTCRCPPNWSSTPPTKVSRRYIRNGLASDSGSAEEQQPSRRG